jgi:hypothetical protein
MTKYKQRAAIAEACGWIFKPDEFGWSFAKINKEGPWCKYVKSERKPFPNYPNDLNAMHEAENILSEAQRLQYWWALYEIVDDSGDNTENLINATCATAAQRAEAFLKTIGKWKSE